MPQKFLSLKNFEKYQSYKHSNPPWFKIHKSMFGDREFTKLSMASRFLYVGLIHLAVESNNKIYNDPTWIGQRLYIPPTEVDLRPLYRAGFLYTSNLHRELSGQSSSVQDSTGQSSALPPAPPPVHKTPKGKTGWPEGYQFTDKHKAIAEGFGLNVAHEFVCFRDKAQANDWRYSNWDAAFRNWLNQEVKYRQRRTA